MRSTWTTSMALAVTMTVGIGQAVGGETAARVRLVPAGQAGDVFSNQYDELTGLWFTAQVDQQGQLSSEVKGRDLAVRKSLVGDRLTVEISAGARALTIVASSSSLELRSGRRAVRFDPKRATEADYDAAKKLLADSRVVGRLRAAASAMGTRLAESPEGTDLLLSDALVAMLDGDPGATRRVRERLRNKLLGTRLAVAAAAGAGGGVIGDCYIEYRNAAYEAMMEAERCVNEFSIWNVPMRNLCNLEFTIRAEAAWFEFLGCSFTRAIRIP